MSNVYCPALPNSTGVPAELCASGSTQTSFDLLQLTATALPSMEFGYFLVSRTQDLVVPPASNGLLCLGGDIGRYNAPGQLGACPTITLAVELGQLPTSTPGSGQAMAGETLNFQC
ncbi:MAG: hypothetical protein GY711_05680 [bacterium]|nr:hypothetical protein [bacterium]